MSFKIPNLASAFDVNQAAPDSVDFDILTQGYVGSGVISGCGVTANAGLQVTVAAGNVIVSGVQVACAGATPTSGAADPTNPRFDLVLCDNAGTVSILAGTAAPTPAFPTVPSTKVALAALFIGAAQTTTGASQIYDKRVLIGYVATQSASPGTAQTGNFNITGSAILGTGLTLSAFTNKSVLYAGASGVVSQDNTNFNYNPAGTVLTANNVNISTLTSGSVPFAGASGAILQDNSNLFWDNTNKRLGVGTAAPAQRAVVAQSVAGNVNADMATFTVTRTADANTGAIIRAIQANCVDNGTGQLDRIQGMRFSLTKAAGSVGSVAPDIALVANVALNDSNTGTVYGINVNGSGDNTKTIANFCGLRIDALSPSPTLTNAYGLVVASAYKNGFGLLTPTERIDMSTSLDVAKLDGLMGPIRYVQVADSTANASSTGAVAFNKTFSIPASYLRIGSVIKVKAMGIYSTTGTPTLAFTWRVGGTAVATSPTYTTFSGAASRIWWLEGTAYVRTLGAPGTLQKGTFNNFIDLGASNVTGTAATTIVDEDSYVAGSAGGTINITTTGSLVVDITSNWGTSSPSNTATMQAFEVEIQHGYTTS